MRGPAKPRARDLRCRCRVAFFSAIGVLRSFGVAAAAACTLRRCPELLPCHLRKKARETDGSMVAASRAAAGVPVRVRRWRNAFGTLVPLALGT